MAKLENITERFALEYETDAHRRWIAGKEIIIHCHHYNSRIQHTIEGTSEIDGKAIIRGAAEEVFAEHVGNALRPDDSSDTKLRALTGLYAHLGYGCLDVSRLDAGEVTASSSHFVEGWSAGFPGRSEPVCTFTEGYLQGALRAAQGRDVWVREEACMIAGAPACKFRIDASRDRPVVGHASVKTKFKPKQAQGGVPSNIDEPTIISALVKMPIYGNEEGIIPAFGVYLANTPADFYNLVCIRFVESMREHGLFSTAKRLLIHDAETCGMNTFHGIIESAEWEALVAPMVKTSDDRLHGVVAVSNGLGWGNWHVRKLLGGASLELESLNGYEALGFRGQRGTANAPQCFMLTGVSAGIMELIYGEGSIGDRFGTFVAVEEECICTDHPSCSFAVAKA